MILEIILKFIILVIMSIMCGMIVYMLFSRNSNYLMERLKKGHSAARKRSIKDDLLEFIKPFTIVVTKNSKDKDSTKNMLIRLGMSANESDITDFENRRTLSLLIWMLLGIIISFVLTYFIKNPNAQFLTGAMLVICVSYYAYKKPTWVLKSSIKKKERAFEKFFPDAIDLLCVCVEAGLSIDSAIERVGREFSNFSYEVGSEFNRIAKDVLSGMSKQEALRGLSERVPNKDIKSFVAIIIQADKMGASISGSLAISADSLRTKRKQRLEAQVSAASTKMTIPLVLCLLPATFAVILTPAIIQVVESLGQMHGLK